MPQDLPVRRIHPGVRLLGQVWLMGILFGIFLSWVWRLMWN